MIGAPIAARLVRIPEPGAGFRKSELWKEAGMETEPFSLTARLVS